MNYHGDPTLIIKAKVILHELHQKVPPDPQICPSDPFGHLPGAAIPPSCSDTIGDFPWNPGAFFQNGIPISGGS